MSYDDSLKFYDYIVAKAGYERKGKTMPYTSHNGHMFSLLNKNGEIGFRYSKAVQRQYFEKYETSYFISYGAKMQGYILLTENMIKDENLLIDLLNESYLYVDSLKKK